MSAFASRHPMGSAVRVAGTRPKLRRVADDGLATPLLNAIVVMLLLLVPVALTPIAGFLSMVACAGAVFVSVMLLGVANVRLGNQQDMAGFLVVPLVISAFQNVYLGVVAPYTSSFYIQMALMTHITFAVMLLAGYFFARQRGPMHPLLVQLVAVSLGIGVFAVVSVIGFHTSPVSMIVSARNMLSPFLFLMLGLLLAERTRLPTFLSLVALLAWATIIFGIVEYLSDHSVWSMLNIGPLWQKKGLPNLAEWGLPANFVSSEKFFGEQIRRMVSSYADPVNFGTVLFFFLMVAWFSRRYWLVFFCLLAITLAVSKGALLGLLIFVGVAAWQSGNRILRVAGIVSAGVVGMAVVAYTLTHSTQSLAAHARGLWTAIETLPQHPLGRGLGGVGVLSKHEGALKESGLGLIIGQLGVLAFVLFGTFFWGIWRWLSRLSDRREKLLGCTLFLGLLANIAFNEVALSPNSSAGYFMLLGLLISGDWLRNAHEKLQGARKPMVVR